MKKFFYITLAAMMALTLFTGCAANNETGAGLSGTVATDGSTSMEKVIGSLGEAFTTENPGVSFTYNPTGSGSGITAVAEGRCDIGLSSRALKEEEKALGLEETILAYDGIAIIVHPDNLVKELTLAQIKQIYTGEIANWSEVGGDDAEIVLIGREAGSGTRDGFEAITGTEDQCAYRQELTSTGDVITTVSQNPAAVGYASLASVKDTVNTPVSGGGSYAPLNYPVTDTNQGEQVGGQIKLSKQLAEMGDTVIITVTPDRGYENEKPVVLDSNKNPLAVTDNGDGTFSFKMPAGEVTVKTEFTKIDYFDDVNEEDWFDEAAWYCAAHNLMQGTGQRQFDGHIVTNRAMLVTVLYRLANSTDDLESIFNDVESGKWYSEAIGWAAHHKIVEGYGNGTFGPNDMLTREQMVAILYRYSVFMKYDVSKLNDLNTFTDADAISDWVKEAMQWAVENGITEGIGNDRISPETGATRAQFAVMMQRYVTTFVK